MKDFIVYDDTGKILRTGNCPSSMVSLQTEHGIPNESVIEGTANDIEDKIIDGRVIHKSKAEIDAIYESMKPDPQEELIRNKMNEIIRRMAIEELKVEGKIGE